MYTPKGYPDIVYVGGDYTYGETIANKRGVVLSTDAGVSGTDMTFDGTDPLHPNGLHPDQHSIVTVPGKPFQFIETNDGGVMRSSGEFVDRSSWCDDPNRGLSGADARPVQADALADPVGAAEPQQGSVHAPVPEPLGQPAQRRTSLQGGTQDNGTWETGGNPNKWENTMIGDGGQSGFDVAIPEFRFHNFTGASPDVNFDNGDFEKWIWTGDPLGTGGEFYAPVISDPVVSKTLFAGTQTVVPDEDRRPRHEDDRRGAGDLQRVDRHVHRGLRRLGRARTDAADERRLGQPRGRQHGRDRADDGRHVERVGGNDHRSRLHLEERRRRSGERGHRGRASTTTSRRRPGGS